MITRKEYKKHKKEFEWYMKQEEEVGIWTDSLDRWDITHNPQWKEDTRYAINDEYTEFRKAILDGKEIEVNTICNGWKLCPNPRWYAEPNEYRIKKEEEFKVGDWITNQGENPVRITKTTDECYWFKTGSWTKNGSSLYSKIELWKPKDNDIVVVWDNNSDYKVVKLYKNIYYQYANIAPYNCDKGELDGIIL